MGISRNVRFFCGFDHHDSTTTLADEWIDATESVSPLDGSGFTYVAGRIDGLALQIASGSSINHDIGNRSPGVKCAAMKSSASDRTLFFITRNGTTSRDVELIWKADGTFHLINGSGTDLGSTGSSYSTGTWYFIEINGDSRNGGRWDLYVDGNLDQSWTSVTTGTTTQNADFVYIGGKTDRTGSTITVDDVVITTSITGSVADDVVLGAARAKYILPTADDALDAGNWTSTGANSWSVLDEVPADTTDNVVWASGNATSQIIQRMEFEDVPSGELVLAQSVIAYWKGNSAGNFSQIQFVEQFSGSFNNLDVKGLLNLYTWRCSVNGGYYDTGGKTATVFNDSEFGFKRLGRVPTVAQCIVEVLYDGPGTPLQKGFYLGHLAFG